MIGWLPAPPAPDNVTLTTPQPQYQPADFRSTVRPEAIPAHHKTRAMAAAAHALKAYPGPAGEVLADAVHAWADLGWLGRAGTPVQRLIDQLMTEPLPPAA